MDVLFRRESATSEQVRRDMEDSPTTTTVRGLLRILEEKGHVRHESDGPRYVYKPAISREAAAARVLPHIVRTFFGGSASRVMAALLGPDRGGLDELEMERLGRLIDDARKRSS